MSDDLVSFKMLVASEVGPECDLLRECAAKAAFPVDYAAIGDPIDLAAIRASVARDNLDFIFLDSCIPTAARRAIYDAALVGKGQPLVVLIGPLGLASREVLQEDATADGMLGRPFGMSEAGAAIDGCARARLPKQVLVVDGAATVRAVIRKVLQASRFRLKVAEAEDSKSAIEQAAKRHPDIVLLDCNMPGLDGFATLDLFKRTHQNAQVIMMAGTRDARLDDRARASGADDFLFKPFYANDVDRILRRLLGLVAVKAS